MSVFIGYPSFMAYQMMKGKKGNNDDFPSIPGITARYSASGLTNEQMAANPVWVDKTGNGHDIQLKNFAWGGMSGVGGYKFNFLSNEWVIDNNQVSKKISYKIVINNKRNSVQLYNRINLGHIKITLKITGIEINKSIFRVYDNVGMEHAQDYTKDGIYEIDYTANEGANIIYFYVFGGNMGQLENPITIEQLPLYPGFILGDGVDDFAVTEKELNFEDTYTVYTAFIPLQNDPIKNMIVCGKDYKKDFYINYGTQLVFYTANSTKSIPLHINQFTVLLCKRDKTTGVIKNLVTGESFQFSVSQLISNPGLYYLWRSATVFSYGKTAIAGQTICNGYFSTDEDDEKVLDWYKKQYPWLFPDQAWTVTGKTNEDEDRATIANITGNGNDLILSNFGFAEGSGYNEEGEYAGYLVTDGVDDIASSNTIIYEADFTFIGEWKFIQKDDTVAGINSSSHLYIQNRYNRGATVMINSTFENKKNITDYMTFKAITSKGKAYDENWNEVDLLYGDGNKGPSGVNIGGQGGTEFCHMIFKNMALYMNKVFSKDDCIKAYNYLQTLKAK